MFFYILNKSQLFSNIETKSRNFRLFIIGCLLYVILHSYLYSAYVDSNQFLSNNRKYIYIIILADILLYLYTYYFVKTSPIIKNTKLKKNKILTNLKQNYEQDFKVNEQTNFDLSIDKKNIDQTNFGLTDEKQNIEPIPSKLVTNFDLLFNEKNVEPINILGKEIPIYNPKIIKSDIPIYKTK
ncbi:Hypothetical protein KVN_LOCUS194 [uncultured virus]|nr:Hypothetical protein KVN_LOCUS194 [uncultured virus]